LERAPVLHVFMLVKETITEKVIVSNALRNKLRVVYSFLSYRWRQMHLKPVGSNVMLQFRRLKLQLITLTEANEISI